jgi:hypothetical protein
MKKSKKRKKGISRALLTIVLLLLVSIAIALFILIGKKILDRLFIGGV